MERENELAKYRARREQIMEIYEAGVGATRIAKELGISRTRVYQIIEKEKARRLKERAVETDE